MTELNDEAKQRVKIVRYNENPFVEKMVVPVKGQIKKVDSEQFVKLFTANIALAFDLKSAGIKTFSVLVWILQQTGLQSNDLIPLDHLVLEDFLNSQDKKLSLSLATFGRGLADLEKSKIIAKHVRQGWYFINPNFVFNGDRKMN